jgi:hypothetical protein
MKPVNTMGAINKMDCRKVHCSTKVSSYVFREIEDELAFCDVILEDVISYLWNEYTQ